MYGEQVVASAYTKSAGLDTASKGATVNCASGNEVIKQQVSFFIFLSHDIPLVPTTHVIYAVTLTVNYKQTMPFFCC